MNSPALRIAAFVAALSGLALSFSSSHSFAQTQYINICQEQVDATEAGTTARLKAALKLTDALYNYDLVAALKQAESTLELARQLKDTDAEAVCHMDQALIRGWLEGRDIGKAHFEKATDTFSGTSSHECQCHYYSSAILYKVFRNSGKFDLTSYFRRHAHTACHCNDPHLTIYRHINFVFIRVVLEKASLADEEIAASRETIRELNQSLQLSDADAMLALLDAMEAKSLSNPAAFATSIQESLEHYQRSGDRLGKIAVHGLIAQQLIESESWDDCLSLYRDSLDLATAHGAQPLVMDCYAKLALFNLKKGLLTEAKQMVEAGLDLEYLKRKTSPFQHPIYEMAFEIACVEQDVSNIAKYGRLLAFQKADSPPGRYDKLITQISQLKYDKNEIQQKFSKKTQALEKQVVSERTNSQAKVRWLTGLAIALAIPILATALIVSIKRLRRISKMLTKEQEHCREGDEIRQGLESKLKHLERTESLGLLAGGIAHDFNNILVGVLGNAELMKLKSDGNDQFMNNKIDQIMIAAEKAADLSHQMLAYTGNHQIARQTMDLNQIVQQLFPLFMANQTRGIEFDVSYFDQPLHCEVDQTQIEQVLLNLASNALAASQDGGRLVIRTGVEVIDDVDDNLLGTRTSGGIFNFVEVQDFGCGIAESKLEKIFDPFYTDAKSGRGLGLAVVYGMVVGHDGLIRLDSAPNKGSRFRILIPQSEISAIENSNLMGSLKDESNTESKTTILVVDDELPVLEFTEQVLASLGWKVIVASCGSDTLDILEDHQDHVSCILMDFAMPVMGAPELLTELHDRSINIPVVLMSGYSHGRFSEIADDPLVVDALEKPFRINQLENAIKGATTIQKPHPLGQAV